MPSQPRAAPASAADPSRSLEAIRREIDTLDDEVLGLLEQRARKASEAIRLKRAAGMPSHDPERESEVLARVESLLPSGSAFPRASIRTIYREILSACLSAESPISVAFLGPVGSFTDMAARRAFGLAATYVALPSIPAAGDAVARSATDYAVVPLENSTEGAVNLTLDTLLELSVFIRGEIILDISHCLLSQQTDLRQVTRVHSHPQALAQCRGWLAEHLPQAQLVATASTSAAAQEAVSDLSAAAIGSRLAGELTGLSIVREGIQDRPNNATRFVVLAKSDAPPTGCDKTSFVFSTRHERGALKRALEVLDGAGLNMTRIESRPHPSQLWEYVFFTDVEGHRAEPMLRDALVRLQERCGFVKMLGSYPKAEAPPLSGRSPAAAEQAADASATAGDLPVRAG